MCSRSPYDRTPSKRCLIRSQFPSVLKDSDPVRAHHSGVIPESRQAPSSKEHDDFLDGNGGESPGGEERGAGLDRAAEPRLSGYWRSSAAASIPACAQIASLAPVSPLTPMPPTW